jgi:hypothetical protein
LKASVEVIWQLSSIVSAEAIIGAAASNAIASDLHVIL